MKTHAFYPFRTITLMLVGWCGFLGFTAASGGAESERHVASPASPVSEAALAETPAPNTAASPEPGPASGSKIRFELGRLDANGLQGPPDGLRALHYEYCIPDRPEAIREVAAIDPSLEIHRGSRGRVGCGAGKLLCLGHTHQSNHRAILERLAELSTILEIRECFFE